MRVPYIIEWLVLLPLVLFLSACDTAPDTYQQSGIDLLSAIADEGFLQADQPRQFKFPEDHGVHPGYRTEWWYVTGHLFAGQRRFGYQVTFFRFVIDAAEDADQPWESDAVWLAQVALSDIEQGEFLTAEQYSRELDGISGAAQQALDVQVQGWRLYQATNSNSSTYQLAIATEQFTLSLSLQTDKPIVLQGDQGWSQKSADDPLNASYYYSQTRLNTQGQLQLGDQQFSVSGNSWLDREWSTNALHARQSGWDWFALQLDNDHELMFYRLRFQDGGVDAASAGVWVDPAGKIQHLNVDDVVLTPTQFWHSPQTGIRYPVAWQMNVTALDLQLRLQAAMPNQLWNTRFTYWEGAMDIDGAQAGKPIAGLGYVELTGY